MRALRIDAGQLPIEGKEGKENHSEVDSLGVFQPGLKVRTRKLQGKTWSYACLRQESLRAARRS